MIYREEVKKLIRKYKIVQSVAGKLSCRRTTLKRCTKIENLWYRKIQDSVLYQIWYRSLARVFRDPHSKIIEEVTS